MGLVESHGSEHCLDYLRFDINSRSWFPKIFETLTLTLGNEMFQFDGKKIIYIYIFVSDGWLNHQLERQLKIQ